MKIRHDEHVSGKGGVVALSGQQCCGGNVREASAAPCECAAAGTRQGRAQAGISCASQVATLSLPAHRVHTGIDFLKVSFWCLWTDTAFLDLCEKIKRSMQETESEMVRAFSYKGQTWNISRTGVRLYPYRLCAGDVVLLLSRRNSNTGFPSVRLEIGSLTSQTQLENTLSGIQVFLQDCGAVLVQEKVSEVHLAADLIGLDIETFGLEDRSRWVSRAVTFSSHYQHWRLTGVCLGKGDFMLRCYNKVLELRDQAHKQEVFRELWGLSSYDEKPVTRVEFQIRRPILKEFGGIDDNGEPLSVSTCDELFGSLAALWRYCSEWARFMDGPVDRKHRHQDRASPSEFWGAVQCAEFTGPHKVFRQRATAHKDVDRLRKQILGCMMSLAAFYVDDIYDFDRIKRFSSRQLIQIFDHFYANDEIEFEARMMRKRNEALVELVPF